MFCVPERGPGKKNSARQQRSEDRGLRKVGDGDTTDNTSLRLIRRIGGGGKGPHWIDIGFTLDSLVHIGVPLDNLVQFGTICYNLV